MPQIVYIYIYCIVVHHFPFTSYYMLPCYYIGRSSLITHISYTVQCVAMVDSNGTQVKDVDRVLVKLQHGTKEFRDGNIAVLGRFRQFAK